MHRQAFQSISECSAVTWTLAVLLACALAACDTGSSNGSTAAPISTTPKKANLPPATPTGLAADICSSVTPGTGWCWQNPLPQGDTFVSVSMVNASVGWAVTGAGNILHTVDGGVHWSAQHLSAPYLATTVTAVSATTLWVTSTGNAIWHSVDGGANWISTVSPWASSLSPNNRVLTFGAPMDASSLINISVQNSNDAWAFYNTNASLKLAGSSTAVPQYIVAHTSDGGLTWTWSAWSTSIQPTALSAVDANTAWVVSQTGVVEKTADGGKTWVQQFQTGPLAYDGPPIVRLPNLNLASSASATPSTPTLVDAIPLALVHAVDQKTVWIAGGQGNLYKTTNGGATWIAAPVPGRNGPGIGIAAIGASSANTVWVSFYFTAVALAEHVALASSTVITTNRSVKAAVTALPIISSVAFTTDGGASWTQASSPVGTSVLAIAPSTANTAVLAGTAGIVLAGNVNSSQLTLQSGVVAPALSSVSVVNAQTAWAVGGAGEVLRTTDGGGSWQVLSSPAGGSTWSEPSSPSGRLMSVAAVDANTAWVVAEPTGFNPLIYKTTDGGSTWQAQVQTMDSSANYLNLWAVSAVDANTAWAVGYSSNVSMAAVILKTVDGGSNWVEQTVPGGAISLAAVKAINASTAWAVGPGGVFKTTDGGSNWIQQQTPKARDNWSTVASVDGNSVWVGAWSGNVIYSANGGSSWATQQVTSAQPVDAIVAVNANTAWAVGGSVFGMGAQDIWKTTDAGTTWVVQNSGTVQALSSIGAVDANTAWVVGSNSSILKTETGGE